jgi:hypothetical protein
VQALQVNRGEYDVRALCFLSLSIAALAYSFHPRPWSPPAAATTVLLALALAYELGWLLYYPPAVALRIRPEEFGPYLFGARCLCFAQAILWVVPELRRFAFPVLVLGHLGIAAWVLRHSSPNIDVLVFLRESAQALLSGRNPYSISFPDPYLGRGGMFYGEGLAVSNRLLFGFPYLPVTLLMAVPGYLLGDVRYSHVVAVVAAAIMMRYVAQDLEGRLAACVFLFTPWIFHLEEMGWTEPFGVALLASVALVWRRSPDLLPWMFGLFLGFKQYAALSWPLGIGMHGGMRFALLSLVPVLVLLLPFAIWDLNGFLHSAVWLQFRQPWRPDALTLANGLVNLGFPRLPWLSFAAAALALVWMWRLRPSATPADFFRRTAFVLLIFFAFSKQSFYNYYFLVVGALCCALALSALTPSVEDESLQH